MNKKARIMLGKITQKPKRRKYLKAKKGMVKRTTQSQIKIERKTTTKVSFSMMKPVLIILATLNKVVNLF